MLYDAALDSIVAAQRHSGQGDIRARSRAIVKAMRIVTELSRCLNHEAGGDLSRNLAALYRYLFRLLVEANTKQAGAPLAEAERLLSTLAEAWKGCTPNPEEYQCLTSDRSLQLASASQFAAADYSAVAR